MRLRSHLLILVCGVLLPMIVFGVSTAALMAQRERAVFQRGAMERTLALVTALDTELMGHATSLGALASSRNLEADDLRAFYAEALRVLASQRSWRSIRLALPSGQRVFDTDAPFGSGISATQERPSFEQALRTGQPAVGNLFVDDMGQYGFAVRIPVASDDQVEYVLSVLVEPAAILALLSPQRLPPDWVGVVLDANHRIVARTVDHEGMLGRPASQSLRSALDRSSEGWFEGATIEDVDVYTPYNRSMVTGWTVAMGIPAAAVEAGASQIMGMLAGGLAGAAAIALLVAAALSRRIAAPIASLVAAAKALEAGERGTPLIASGVREVGDVGQALAAATAAVGEREDALRAADRAKDEFLAMLGHELRNPLAALTSAVQVLQMTLPEEPRLRTTAGILERQILHMTRLVDDLLDVSRVTSGKVKLSREQLDLAAVVTNVVRAMRSSGRLDEHEIEVDVTPARVSADEARIEQIVMNLLGNAVKYTPARGRINVLAERRNGQAMLKVTDSGVGIAPDLLPRVFDLFVQAEQGVDRSLGGLGVGLTLVKRLTEMHGGTVRATSDGPGRGATFTVLLPALDEEQPARSRAPSSRA
jgi:signal transduction histidine kinase